MPKIVFRDYSRDSFSTLVRHGLHPVLARVYAARGIEKPEQLDTQLAGLLAFERLKNAREMARILADAIRDRKHLLIVADYDTDGATACAVGVRALREFGAVVDYIVPNRFEYGYGLTPEIVHLAAGRQPDILITVDNGIASVEGVAEANRLGMSVLITDHHLPGDELPQAACIINPNQPGCDFPSKNLAGVGVIFYLMLALRAELRSRGTFTAKSPLPPFEKGGSAHAPGDFKKESEPNLAKLLDLVALGTVADVVKLDDNNRLLVHQGLKRIREGRTQTGIQALFQATGRNMRRASTHDLAFALAPRLNSAGRLEDMALGIECLITDDMGRALEIAKRLDALNRERREIEANMHDSALAMLENKITQDVGWVEAQQRRNPPSCWVAPDGSTQPTPLSARDSYTLCLYDPAWHQGVIGILASRIKDRLHRPVIAFAPGINGEIKGSGRSISAMHLRDALDLVAKRHPGLLVRFGGHAAAAGLTLREQDFARFSQAFEETAKSLLAPGDLERVIETDGALQDDEMTLEMAHLMQSQVWGQGFPQPTFNDQFTVASQRVVGEKHLKLKLRKNDSTFDAILFFRADTLPSTINAMYRLESNEYNGVRNLQLTIEHWEPV